jgi:CHASE3 domain sensor protein
MKSAKENKIDWIFIISLASILIVAFTTFQTFVIFRDNTLWVIHTHKVQESLESLLSHLKDAETGQRGYLITGEDSYLEPFNISLSNIDKEFSLLKEITSDNPVQQNKFPSLEILISSKISELNETINLRRNSGFKAAQEVVLTHQGKLEMDGIRQILKDMKNEENSLLVGRVEAEMKSYYIYFILATVLFVTLFISFFFIKKYFKLNNSRQEYLDLKQ